ncbi:Facilitated trehalose transporter Tret1-2-like 2 [Homarus americanus]|uniref:Facilitated trehalose transporter Tret1-2-like 2 n=1 Tax=Homarus americanus TaxID=6706 RepID=A0A8J5JTR7_HOMAM|nr:Facilitated trehalose transporter Tret1-2-like 2 [Homarus americanus]
MSDRSINRGGKKQLTNRYQLDQEMSPDEPSATDKLTTGVPQEQVEEHTGARRRRIFTQVVMVLGASLGHVGLAIVAAWPNPAVPDMRSIVAIGNLPGTLLWGWLVATIGRKTAMMLLVLPYTLAWCLVALAVNPTMLLAGRVVHGICIGATFVSASTYVIELPDTSIRGAVATIPNVGLSLGFIITPSLGLVLRWYEIAFVGLAIIVAHTIVMAFLPESPSFLAIKGQEKKAKQILLKLRGPSANVDEELQTLCEENKEKAKEPLVKVLQEPIIQRSVGIVVTLFFVQNFCGLMVFSVNMTRIFLEAGSTMSEHVASILVFLVQAAGTILACIYLDRFGRRICLVFSLAVMTICLVTMGVYHYFQDATMFETDSIVKNITGVVTNDDMDERSAPTSYYTWVPLLCLMVYMFTSSCGAGPVPALLNAEYFPTAVRAQLSGLCMVLGSMLNFAALQLFTPMQVALTTAGLYWFYAAISIFGIFFTLICVRETKGKAVG